MLGLDERTLANIFELPESFVLRMRDHGTELPVDRISFERGALFLRMFTLLDAITAGDGSVAKAWLANRNDALGDAPINLIRTAAGLTKVVGYLDSRNARV
jgi:antitoxin Xre/MbcA/ParS-like protein